MRITFPLLFLSFFFWSCSEDKKAEELILNPFPNADFNKVVAFKLNGDNKRIIDNKNLLSSTVVGEGITLSKEQSDKLLAIYRDKESYGDDFFRCFEPHLGFVFYDVAEKVVAHSTVCFSCNWMQNSPDIGAFIFSVKGARSLSRLEKDIFSF